ncbi:mannose-6-phosphate isomerase, class I [Cellulomonas fimi]|uniref:mannose-6-phosphate isomerase n=1 Tax=Cellulomonas fimi (strain ATCC 484 / DSM 20113 / JCM 1341 / CCUG 24087 / LMG 16345 / NBRC 15513 / NCIMB 8980 / NCTC 7547 / NRS-133) TaxID=590998 RepID=F4H544_CELFA|nr:mannose-6-phosphate isomerase, class I [Cellulomonas fimi]AEE46650.1 mannose-6-phosphate isomerase, class I [Cellulomonas fimi ATCC 484]VEH33773.1 Mannose-6-phosphate isomerase [Cellulomonas fimi]
MRRMTPARQHYAWGSTTAIPDLLCEVPDGRPVAEAWFGAHPSSPALVHGDDEPTPLDTLIADDPTGTLGDDVAHRFGEQLPYLLKVIAAESPLSLQVHPSREAARRGYEAEDRAGIPVDAPHRNYRDRNHKPELVYALTRFDAMVGFRAPRRAAELLRGLDAPLAAELHELLVADPTSAGVHAAFEWLLAPDTRPGHADVQKFADACAQRLVDGSPSPRTDRTVMRLAAAYPGDAGAVTSVLLNPVTLHPGEALFVPAGSVHAYLHGLGVEIMANSDNVLRAGLTAKHIDLCELLANLDAVAAPPIRIAPERVFTSTEIFYAPVDDFELSVTRLTDEGVTRVPGRGPRVLLCLEGEVEVHNERGGLLLLTRGQAAFAPASDGALTARGDGVLVQADVP